MCIEALAGGLGFVIGWGRDEYCGTSELVPVLLICSEGLRCARLRAAHFTQNKEMVYL